MTNDRIVLDKTFIDDPVSPGDTVTLRFEVSNLAAPDLVTVIGFTDDLGAAPSALESISGMQSDTCGAGSEISGTSLLTFSGGGLPGPIRAVSTSRCRCRLRHHRLGASRRR